MAGLKPAQQEDNACSSKKAKAVTRPADHEDRETRLPFECKRCWSKGRRSSSTSSSQWPSPAISGRFDCAWIDSCPREETNLFCELPPLAKAADAAVAATAAIVSAAAAGDVTADEAAKLAKVISLYIDSLEAHQFEDRLAKLEGADLERGVQVTNDAPVSQ